MLIILPHSHSNHCYTFQTFKLTVTFEDVRNVKSVQKIPGLVLRLYNLVLVIAVCVLFLIKLRWLKTKRIYNSVSKLLRTQMYKCNLTSLPQEKKIIKNSRYVVHFRSCFPISNRSNPHSSRCPDFKKFILTQIKSFVSDESIGVKSLQMALVFHLNQLLELWASWSSYSWNLTLAWYQIFVFSFPLTLTTAFLNKSKPLYRSRGISKTTPEIKIYHPPTPPYTLLNPPHSKKVYCILTNQNGVVPPIHRTLFKPQPAWHLHLYHVTRLSQRPGQQVHDVQSKNRSEALWKLPIGEFYLLCRLNTINHRNSEM